MILHGRNVLWRFPKSLFCHFGVYLFCQIFKFWVTDFWHDPIQIAKICSKKDFSWRDVFKVEIKMLFTNITKNKSSLQSSKFEINAKKMFSPKQTFLVASKKMFSPISGHAIFILRQIVNAVKKSPKTENLFVAWRIYLNWMALCQKSRLFSFYPNSTL